MQLSKELGHIAARNVRPFVFDASDTPNVLANLAALGVCGITPQTAQRMIANMQAARQAGGVGLDADVQAGITTASISTPIQFLQTWLPGFIAVITAARKIDDLVGVTTVGAWEHEEIVQGILEQLGTAVPYGDYTNVPLASWNPNFERRTIVRFEEGMRVGVLEEARAAAIQVSSAQTKRSAATLALEINRNKIGFNGYNAGLNRTYGFLNDPNLPAALAFPAGAGGTTWALKTFLEICKDLRLMISALRSQSQDVIDPETVALTLGLASNVVDALSTTSDMGVSVRNWLTENYPKIRVVSAPELNLAIGGASNEAYLYAESVDDQMSTDDRRVWLQSVPAKFRLIGTQQQTKGYEEDYSNATAGVFLKRPYAVVRYYGN